MRQSSFCLARALRRAEVMRFPVHLRRGRWMGLVQAYCPDLPGCFATALTEAEALLHLRERIVAYFREPAPSDLPADVSVTSIEL